MKPSWVAAPEDARFLAKDENGDWWWYTDEPYWDAKSGRWMRSKGLAYLGYRKPREGDDPEFSLEQSHDHQRHR